jgi:hypothetical protein
LILNTKFEINHLDVELANSKKDVKNAESDIAQIKRRNEEKINSELKLYNNYNSQKLYPSEIYPMKVNSNIWKD